MIPFSNGSQFMDWLSANCDRCKKYNEDVDKTCDIEYALGMAYVNDGKITDEMAKRCGADVNKGKFQWMCPEVDWTEEWKKEYLEKTTGGVNK